MAFTAGDTVMVRGQRWVVEETTAFADCTALQLTHGVGSRTRRRCLLAPFDRPILVPPERHIQVVTKRQWAFRFEAQLSSIRHFGRLRAAYHAAIEILPFQLEPALALLRGRARRFLLADEVGLGKTIQAGLMIAELQHRGWCERALIVTPSGLRQQWSDELSQRFQMRAPVLDASALSTRTASLPLDVNPWTIEPVTITSIDFIKQPEVLRGLADVVWDVVVVDEAHQAAPVSQRYDAVAALARRTRHLILLTATPHGGDDGAYRALCGLGCARGHDPILLFRRTRDQTSVPRTRRAHLLRVALSESEQRMHRLLEAYVSRVWSIARATGTHDLWLLAMVLTKRALSSAASLRESLERRLAGLGSAEPASEQPALPFSDDDPTDDAVVPGTAAFERPHEEQAVLEQLLDAARQAAGDERKMRAVARLLRRTREPAIVFTEYRDTLNTIVFAAGPSRRIAMLHGGLTPDERRAAVAAFCNGDADLLVATDAGSEGLNLHHRCRLVINLELPWNPIRLEQRIGRVDRIGQTRTVHAVNLLAGGTPEESVLSALSRRLERIRMSEIEMAGCLIGGAELPRASRTEPELCETTDTRAQAEDEAQRIARRRLHARAPAQGARSVGTCVIRMPPASIIAFVRARLLSGAGRLVEDVILPVRVVVRQTNRIRRRSQLREMAKAFIAAMQPSLLDAARVHMFERARVVEAEMCGAVDATIARERWIAANVHEPSRLVQPGLFERRARRVSARPAAESPHNAETGVTAGEPEIELLLFTW